MVGQPRQLAGIGGKPWVLSCLALLLAVDATLAVGLPADDLVGAVDGADEWALDLEAHPVAATGSQRMADGDGLHRIDGSPRFERILSNSGPAAPAGLPARVLEPSVPWVSMLAPGDEETIDFHCPASDGSNVLSGDAAQTIVVRANCPFRIIDDQDLLGSAQLAVDSNDPNNMAFFSLHGAATDQGPTPRSRTTASGGVGARQSHTAFTSTNQGLDWKDNPHGREGFGEMADGLMDRSGRIYATYLYSSTIGADEEGKVFDYHFQLYHDNDVEDGMSHFGTKVRNRAAGNSIDEVNLVLVTPRVQIETQAEYEALRNETKEEQDPFNGTAAPSSEEELGDRADGRPGNYTDDPSFDVVMAVWHERAYDYANSTTGMSSWIDAVWTTVGPETDWDHLRDNQLIGPCRDASDPVAYNGRAYVACVVDAGYNGRAGAKIGETDIWAIDPAYGDTELISTIPGLIGGTPRLAINEAGRMAVTSVRLMGDGPAYDNVQVRLSWGWYGRHWDGPPQQIGSSLHGYWYDSVVSARVSAMTLTNDTSSLYLSYSERGNNSLGQPNVDPNGNQFVGPNDFVEYGKVLAKFQHCVPYPLMVYDLQVGQVRHPFQEGVVNNFTGAFDDLQDGMSTWIHPETKEPFIYFVYGDHGVIQYGAFSGLTSGIDECIIVQPPILFTSPPAVPVSLAPPAGVPLGLTTGAGVAGAAGLGMLVRQKRQQIVALATKAK